MSSSTDDMQQQPLLEVPRSVSMQEAFWVWFRIACLSFGGPAGQIAVMHRIIVDEKKWISEERFLHALNYCMLLPGPEAQQLATYIGWLMHRTRGGLMAGLLFIAPGFLSILILSMAYACYQDTGFVQAILFGLKPAVMAIVLQAVIRISRRVLKNNTMLWIAAISFVLIFFLDMPFPIIVLASGLAGFVGGYYAPSRFSVIKSHGPISKAPKSGEISEVAIHVIRPSLRHSLVVSAVCLSLWFIPLIVIARLYGTSSVYFLEGSFFSKAAVVTFGGAYSVLAYIAQEAVHKYEWLKPGEMLDGLGMAETTPGPLIMVVQFVGFMGAYRSPGGLDPIVAGILGSVITTWVTFVPCFFWIFLGAPYIERLRGNVLLSSALSTITASVVGVVLSLAIWFSMHTLFSDVSKQSMFGFIRMSVPEIASVDWFAAVLAIVACAMIFLFKRSMGITLGVSVLLGMAFYWVGR